MEFAIGAGIILIIIALLVRKPARANPLAPVGEAQSPAGGVVMLESGPVITARNAPALPSDSVMWRGTIYSYAEFRDYVRRTYGAAMELARTAGYNDARNRDATIAEAERAGDTAADKILRNLLYNETITPGGVGALTTQMYKAGFAPGSTLVKDMLRVTTSHTMVVRA